MNQPSDWRQARAQMALEDAVRRLGELEVGQTLQISENERVAYRHATEELRARGHAFHWQRHHDEYRVWWIGTRLS